MGKFKRFCMIVFVVAAVLGIGVLAALWFAWEPLFPAIAWLMSMPWFFVVEAVLLGITALGLLVVLIRAITAPGKNSQLELERDNGSIAITQNAIQSTVKHVVESHHGLSTDNVWARSCRTRSPRRLKPSPATPSTPCASRSQATPTWLRPRSHSRPRSIPTTRAVSTRPNRCPPMWSSR